MLLLLYSNKRGPGAGSPQEVSGCGGVWHSRSFCAWPGFVQVLQLQCLGAVAVQGQQRHHVTCQHELSRDTARANSCLPLSVVLLPTGNSLADTAHAGVTCWQIEGSMPGRILGLLASGCCATMRV